MKVVVGVRLVLTGVGMVNIGPLESAHKIFANAYSQVY